MSRHTDSVRLKLARGPLPGRQLFESMGISQPTGSRALKALGSEIIRIDAARPIQYALRDPARALPDIAVHRVDTEGRVRTLGTLIPVRPEGFVMHQENGVSAHFDGLPWWLFDMRPQGYLGRAYAARHGSALGLPSSLSEWSDTHALRALLAHGEDAVGNLLLGELARDRFLSAALPEPISHTERGPRYARLALEAARGETPGSSAGGEQPKFSCYAETPQGPRHLIVKFSEAHGGAVSERWRDLLLAEHLALENLRAHGVEAAVSRILDHGTQRFLEVERFDRVGEIGRRALLSLAAFDLEFVGMAPAGWPRIARRLVELRQIRAEAADGAELLWAFGTLIGNTDMHPGNLSFVSDHGRPYELAPAYDMSPMCFAPRSGGSLPDKMQDVRISAEIRNETWQGAAQLAQAFQRRVETETRFSARFAPCIEALSRHLAAAGERIGRLL